MPGFGILQRFSWVVNSATRLKMCLHPFHNKRSLIVAELTGPKPRGSSIRKKPKKSACLPEAFSILYPRDASCDHKNCRIYMELLLAQMKRMADGYQKSCAFAAWIASLMQKPPKHGQHPARRMHDILPLLPSKRDLWLEDRETVLNYCTSLFHY